MSNKVNFSLTITYRGIHVKYFTSADNESEHCLHLIQSKQLNLPFLCSKCKYNLAVENVHCYILYVFRNQLFRDTRKPNEIGLIVSLNNFKKGIGCGYLRLVAKIAFPTRLDFILC